MDNKRFDIKFCGGLFLVILGFVFSSIFENPITFLEELAFLTLTFPLMLIGWLMMVHDNLKKWKERIDKIDSLKKV